MTDNDAVRQQHQGSETPRAGQRSCVGDNKPGTPTIETIMCVQAGALQEAAAALTALGSVPR